jgi:flagellar hook-associated protein FlgK
MSLFSSLNTGYSGLNVNQAALALAREDLANLANMTTSNAIRTLSTFVDEGIIKVDGKKIKIVNIDKLRRISELG